MAYQPYERREQTWHIAGGFLLSIAIHVVFLLQLSQMHLPDADIPHQVSFVEVELVSMATAHETPQPPKPQTPEKPQQSEPPIAQEKIEPPKEKVVKPKPVQKMVKKTALPMTKQSIAHQTAPTPTTHTAVVSDKVVNMPIQPNPQQLENIRQQYLARIIAVIQAHKSYPYSARRRHIEGDIQVSFMVDAQGQISELRITGGSSVLRASTQQAIEDALPFPQPPQHQTIHSHFIMQYRLK